MYSLYLTLLLSILHLPALAVEYRLRAQAPAPTTPPLFRRQEESVCAAGQTSCNDGLPGCCSYGNACTFTGNHIPVCIGLCNGGPTCSGVFNGGCCPLGYTCDYQSTLCGSGSDIFSNTPLTEGPPPIPGPSAAAPSISPSPIAPPSALPTSQAAPPSPATSGTPPSNQPPTTATMPPATQSSATDALSSDHVASSLSAAGTSVGNSLQSFDPQPSTIPSSKTVPTAAQTPTATVTVKSNSGANLSALHTRNIIAFSFTLLSIGLGIMTIF